MRVRRREAKETPLAREGIGAALQSRSATKTRPIFSMAGGEGWSRRAFSVDEGGGGGSTLLMGLSGPPLAYLCAEQRG